ncbi:MAG TPA: 5-formyltetrahydrofolate cyclo-ligase [Burkholderiales bacterium]|nr:5-formyltetrahydrofolate cyclo-ligase [Burkholderiales bacterium]
MDDAQLKAWRKQLRAELIAKRLVVSPEDRASWNEAIGEHVLCAFPNLAKGVVAFCWPHRNEFDARFLMRELRKRGAITALPVVVAPKTPMIFREWYPGVKTAKGVYDIPYPVESAELAPDTILVPMNGFDEHGHRLGYGGGYFDRTLASLKKHPCIIGVTYELARIPTIEPQSYDIPMDYIVTERGVYERSDGKIELLSRHGQNAEPGQYSSPPCYAKEISPDYFGGKKD